MKTKRYDGSDLRMVLSSMIVNDRVCARISSQWNTEGLFDAKWANLVGGLVVDYHSKYGRNPNGQMTKVFEEWARNTTADEKTVDAVSVFLQGLSDESLVNDNINNSDYMIDVAGRYFNKVRTEREIATANTELESGRVEDAQDRLSKMSRVNLGVGSYLDPSEDPEAWALPLKSDRRQPFVRYRERLGDFIGDYMTSSSLFAFMAPDKTGKTAWLVDLAYRATRNQRRVAFFDCGDSDEAEVMLRWNCRTTGRPEYEEDLVMPIGWDNDGKLIVQSIRTPAYDPMHSYMEFKRVCKLKHAFKVSCHSSDTLSAMDIYDILGGWENEGWIPDVVCIDYADILAHPKGIRDPLDQIDKTWKSLRRISQDKHCCVVTATQSSSLAYSKKDNELLTKADFSGRKTKLAHVNGVLGINVNSAEKDVGAARINWIVRRKGKYNEKHYVKVAGCMAIGNPAIISK